MRVHIEPNWMRDGFDIWFYEHAGRYTLVHRYGGDGEWRSEPVEDGQERGPSSLYLPRPLLEDLIRASQSHVHAEDATVQHRDDAVAVRDRLLTLIEKRGIR